MKRLVADASAAVDAIATRSPQLRAVLTDADEIHVPEHFHIEALSAIRGIHLRGGLDLDGARDALDLLAGLRVLRHPVLPMSRGIWSMRDTLTAYDAAYLVLARDLDVPLVTVDGALRSAAQADGRLAGPS